MQPSTKRLRSRSIGASQSSKQAKRRNRNTLCESTIAEDAMDVDDNPDVYVPTVVLPLVECSPSFQVPFSNTKEAISPYRASEISFIPSSVSDEKELDLIHVAPKDVSSVKEAIDRWRQGTLSPSPLTGTSFPVEVETEPQPVVQPPIDADWIVGIDSVSSATPSRRNAAAVTNVFILTSPSTGSSAPLSPVKLLDEKAKTDQIIAEIRARAEARPRSQASSSPVFEVASLDSSDDEDDGYDSLAALGYNADMRGSRCLYRLLLVGFD